MYDKKKGIIFPKPKEVVRILIEQQPERFRYATRFERVWNLMSKNDYKNLWRIGKIITGIAAIALTILINFSHQ